MDMNEIVDEELIQEVGGETGQEVVQSIPGTAPTFDTITEDELACKKIIPKAKKSEPDPDAYRATSSINNQ